MKEININNMDGIVCLHPKRGKTEVLIDTAYWQYFFKIKGKYPETPENVSVVESALRCIPDQRYTKDSVKDLVEKGFGVKKS